MGVAPDIEFVATELDPLAQVTSSVTTNTYINHGSLALLFEGVLGDVRFRSPWKDLDNSIHHVTAEVLAHLAARGEQRAVQRVEVVRPVLLSDIPCVYRRAADWTQLPRAARHRPEEHRGGMLVDAVMLAEGDVSIVFSFSRSYFHVDLEHVAEAVVFLKSLMPKKPVSELFTVLGRARQGKTERYREIMRHLAGTPDRFVHAPGQRGLVMVCFTLTSFDVVFKVIRDRFASPKSVLREEVLAKYQLVFRHDRAGRLVDAQEFRRLRFPKARFDPQLLAELLAEASLTVREAGEYLIFDHIVHRAANDPPHAHI